MIVLVNYLNIWINFNDFKSIIHYWIFSSSFETGIVILMIVVLKIKYSWGVLRPEYIFFRFILFINIKSVIGFFKDLLMFLIRDMDVVKNRGSFMSSFYYIFFYFVLFKIEVWGILRNTQIVCSWEIKFKTNSDFVQCKISFCQD